MPAPTLDLLATFARVADRDGFTRAARELGLSKATVSKQIAALEQDLGVRLFHRTTRKLTLTEAGARAHARAMRILEEVEAIREEAGEARTNPRGRLKIAAPMSFAAEWLGPALPDFLTAYPEIQLELALDDRRIDLVAEGFDAALRISDMPDSSLSARKLAPVRTYVVAAPAYWAARGKPRHPSELAMHACFRYVNLPSAGVWRFVRPDGEEARVGVDGPLCVNNGAIEVPALLAGLGVARLPDFLIARQVATGALETALDDWCGAPLWLHLLSPSARAQPRKLKAFSDFLHEKFAGERAPWLSLMTPAPGGPG
jgi:DNA-binding transcriptional LysR family regulator